MMLGNIYSFQEPLTVTVDTMDMDDDQSFIESWDSLERANQHSVCAYCGRRDLQRQSIDSLDK